MVCDANCVCQLARKCTWQSDLAGIRFLSAFSKRCTFLRCIINVLSLCFSSRSICTCCAVSVYVLFTSHKEKCDICHKEMLKRNMRRISSWLSRNLSNVALPWGFLTSTRECRSISVIHFSEFMRITYEYFYNLYLKAYHDLLSVCLCTIAINKQHKRKCAIITLRRRISEIA